MNEFERLHAEMNRLAAELRRGALGAFSATAQWRPAVNAYRLHDRFVICFDLAGMDRKDISVRVEARRLIVSGTRPAPEPPPQEDRAARLLMMEIDYGPFERALELPHSVDAERVTAVYRDGLLWITLPLARPAQTIHPAQEHTT